MNSVQKNIGSLSIIRRRGYAQLKVNNGLMALTRQEIKPAAAVRKFL